jgi:hypothetical protein
MFTMVRMLWSQSPMTSHHVKGGKVLQKVMKSQFSFVRILDEITGSDSSDCLLGCCAI